MNAINALEAATEYWADIGTKTGDTFLVGRADFFSKDAIHVQTSYKGSVFYTLVAGKKVSGVDSFDFKVSLGADAIEAAAQNEEQRYVLREFLAEATRAYEEYRIAEEARRSASVPFPYNGEGVHG